VLKNKSGLDGVLKVTFLRKNQFGIRHRVDMDKNVELYPNPVKFFVSVKLYDLIYDVSLNIYDEDDIRKCQNEMEDVYKKRIIRYEKGIFKYDIKPLSNELDSRILTNLALVKSDLAGSIEKVKPYYQDDLITEKSVDRKLVGKKINPNHQ